MSEPIHVYGNIYVKFDISQIVISSDGGPHGRATGFKGSNSPHRLCFNMTKMDYIDICVVCTYNNFSFYFR